MTIIGGICIPFGVWLIWLGSNERRFGWILTSLGIITGAIGLAAIGVR